MNLDETIFHVGVPFNEGQMDIAAERSSLFANINADEFGHDNHKIQGPLLYCINTKRFDIASLLINKAFPEMVSVLEEGVGPSGASEIMWVKDGDKNRFVFHPCLRDCPFNECHTIITRWFHVLKICRAYNLAGEPGGRTLIGVGDLTGLPGLSFCDNREDYAILIPDSSFLSSNGYLEERSAIAKAWRPYKDRKPLAFWRGSSTGMIGARRKDIPRTKLCLEAMKNTKLFDCAISLVVQADEVDTEDLKNLGVIGSWADTSDLVAYKIQIDIDGNSNSWPGFFSKLLTGSPVMKVVSEDKYKQWYYDRLEPFVHYIPVKSDLSNMHDVAQMLIDDEALAERIGRAGRAFAEDMTIDAEVNRCLGDVRTALAKG